MKQILILAILSLFIVLIRAEQESFQSEKWEEESRLLKSKHQRRKEQHDKKRKEQQKTLKYSNGNKFSYLENSLITAKGVRITAATPISS